MIAARILGKLLELKTVNHHMTKRFILKMNFGIEQRAGVCVIVHWVEEKVGKIFSPITEPYYVITEPLKFSSGEEIVWSLLVKVESDHYGNSERVCFGVARFLFADAPSELLVSGFKLKVFEGPKFVATLEVV